MHTPWALLPGNPGVVTCRAENESILDESEGTQSIWISDTIRISIQINIHARKLETKDSTGRLQEIIMSTNRAFEIMISNAPQSLISNVRNRRLQIGERARRCRQRKIAEIK